MELHQLMDYYYVYSLTNSSWEIFDHFREQVNAGQTVQNPFREITYSLAQFCDSIYFSWDVE